MYLCFQNILAFKSSLGNVPAIFNPSSCDAHEREAIVRFKCCNFTATLIINLQLTSRKYSHSYLLGNALPGTSS